MMPSLPRKRFRSKRVVLIVLSRRSLRVPSAGGPALAAPFSAGRKRSAAWIRGVEPERSGRRDARVGDPDPGGLRAQVPGDVDVPVPRIDERLPGRERLRDAAATTSGGVADSPFAEACQRQRSRLDDRQRSAEMRVPARVTTRLDRDLQRQPLPPSESPRRPFEFALPETASSAVPRRNSPLHDTPPLHLLADAGSTGGSSARFAPRDRRWRRRRAVVHELDGVLSETFTFIRRRTSTWARNVEWNAELPKRQ
jgi:hypothetical protein